MSVTNRFMPVITIILHKMAHDRVLIIVASKMGGANKDTKRESFFLFNLFVAVATSAESRLHFRTSVLPSPAHTFSFQFSRLISNGLTKRVHHRVAPPSG